MRTMLSPTTSSVPSVKQQALSSSRPDVRANLFKNVKKSGTTLDKQGGGKDFAKPAPSVPKQEKKRDDGGGLSGVIQALDFSQARSKGDAEILYETKDNWKPGQSKMSREQYAALRRKIGGTYKDYFKDYIEVDVFDKTYTKQGDASTGTVPYLPLLIGVVVAMLGATAVVVAKTGV
ncbi:hypothetical protein DUNSADRAFT_1499 [Dunaliella salina]|uniref:Uncharacterized protein n=1 Tax=Dunaliella salina TaxID=3046 RepID=A0ABQ7FXC7_DUNSA|nr:hypothetical protein DUNSADRAFT_1499 [Dunaliella salina]|eukprot:KAF5827010.1 hypothetical protein DUNSADRAFT_1499 [Dunaliella salina]